MFSWNTWQEIFESIRKNKLRTTLTAFTVSWGIFLLIMLLGFGNGLRNGAMVEFEEDAVNSLWVNGGRTSLAYNGNAVGREIEFDNEDLELLRKRVKGAEHMTGRNNLWRIESISYKNYSTSFSVMACNPGYRYLENLEMLTGRFINETDIDKKNKVAVLGVMAVEQLFQDEDPIGKYINVNRVPFLVVGTFADAGGERDQLRLYMPISTAQMLYGQANSIQQISMITPGGDLETSAALEAEITKILAAKYDFDPNDPRAVRIWNSLENYEQFMGLFKGIKLFVWGVGILTIIAGIIGVGNIMLITVKERTKEIGIRKALGAKSISIIAMIMQESVLITLISGYIGLVVGVGLWALVNYALTEFQVELPFFRNPEVDFGTAVSAVVILVISGAIAGLIPAIRAANVNPIQAIREE